MDRRSFLEQAAVVTVMVAGGEVWRAFAQHPPEYGAGPAFEPWTTWRDDARRGPLALVAAAILSSNAFNTQPWLFKVGQSDIELYAATRRNLGAFDPYLREMHFSLGCALENLLLAARANGYDASVALVPGKLAPPTSQEPNELVARVTLAPGKATSSELYEAIPHRHTNRQPFDPAKPLPNTFIRALDGLTAADRDVRLFLFTSATDRKRLVDAIVDSARMMADPDVQRGTAPWLHRTMSEWQTARDGSYVGPDASPGRSSLEQYRSLMLSGPLFGLIAVRDRYDREQTIRAGRVWQRAHLLATARQVAARPANGAVETIDHEKRLQQEPHASALLAQITGDATWQPTFMFYMGVPTVPAVASARRGVRDVVV